MNAQSGGRSRLHLSEMLKPIQQLAALLQKGNAKPDVVSSRLAPSAIYDVEYRMAIIALVFDRFAKPSAPAPYRKMSSARLKLLQFIAFRPWLLAAIKEWSEAGKQDAFTFSQSMRIRRGFLSDTAHDDLIEYLVACGVLLRNETQIVTGKNATVLADFVEFILQHSLFSSERRAIEELASVSITNEMLEGW